MRYSFLAAIPATLMVSGVAFAQAPAAPPPSAAPGSAGVVAPQPGSTGAPNATTVNPTGRPGDTITNSSSAGGNAGQPSRAVPQGGGGGGGSK